MVASLRKNNLLSFLVSHTSRVLIGIGVLFMLGKNPVLAQDSDVMEWARNHPNSAQIIKSAHFGNGIIYVSILRTDLDTTKMADIKNNCRNYSLYYDEDQSIFRSLNDFLNRSDSEHVAIAIDLKKSEVITFYDFKGHDILAENISMDSLGTEIDSERIQEFPGKWIIIDTNKRLPVGSNKSTYMIFFTEKDAEQWINTCISLDHGMPKTFESRKFIPVKITDAILAQMQLR